MTLTQEQLDMRRTGIGASEVAAVLGLDPWRTPLDVYLSKVEGIAAKFTDKGREALEWGNVLEPIVAQWYADNCGVPVTLLDTGTLVHPSCPWIFATPDKRVVRQDDPDIEWGLEIKVRRSGEGWGPSGSSEVPVTVRHQCLWGMVLTGYRRWDVAALIGGTDSRMYTITASDKEVRDLQAKVTDWWGKHVIAKVPPPFTTDREAGIMYAAEDVDPDTMVCDMPELHTAAQEYAALVEAGKAMDAELERLRVQMKQAMGKYTSLMGPDWVATWKPSRPSRVTDWEAVAQHYAPPADLVEQHTATKPGSRRFLFKSKAPTPTPSAEDLP